MGKWINHLPHKEGRYFTKPSSGKVEKANITKVSRVLDREARVRIAIDGKIADEKTASEYKWHSKDGKTVEPIPEPSVDED